jgi:hypothetical protein
MTSHGALAPSRPLRGNAEVTIDSGSLKVLGATGGESAADFLNQRDPGQLLFSVIKHG